MAKKNKNRCKKRSPAFFLVPLSGRVRLDIECLFSDEHLKLVDRILDRP
jgi:hypothetical protein